MTKEQSNTLTIDMLELLTAHQQNGIQGMMEVLLDALMVAERQIHMNAMDHQHAAARTAYANGFKSRQLNTGVGTLALNVPQTRATGNKPHEPYYPTILERGIRSERSLVLAIAEMYFNGVSTRDVEKVAQKLGIDGLSSTQVSNCAALLDEELQKWRERELGEMTVVMFDACYDKVRVDGVVQDAAILSAVGFDTQGRRSVLGVSVSRSDAEVHWRSFFESLTRRGLHGVKLIVSDDHSGMAAARKRVFAGIPWQRCQFHLAQNAQAYCNSKPQKSEVSEELRRIMQAGSLDSTQVLLSEFVERWAPINPKLAEWAEHNIPESFTVIGMGLPVASLKYFRTSNTMERCIQQEIKRRNHKVRVFPSDESLLRLVSAQLMEMDETWQSSTRQTYRKAVEAIHSHAEQESMAT